MVSRFDLEKIDEGGRDRYYMGTGRWDVCRSCAELIATLGRGLRQPKCLY